MGRKKKRNTRPIHADSICDGLSALFSPSNTSTFITWLNCHVDYATFNVLFFQKKNLDDRLYFQFNATLKDAAFEQNTSVTQSRWKDQQAEVTVPKP